MTASRKSAIAKRSVVIGGHKTSISLEEPFWHEIRAIAGAQQMTVSSLLRQIDHERKSANLSSAIRVYVLEYLRDRARAAQQDRLWSPGPQVTSRVAS
jgi:predicted DNA-binding ribbon-helix-helix protein